MEQNTEKTKTAAYPLHRVIILQILACIVLVLFGIGIKDISDYAYLQIQEYYVEMMEDSLTGQKVSEWLARGEEIKQELYRLGDSAKNHNLTLEELWERIKAMIEKARDG